MTLAAWVSLIVAVVGAIGGGFKLWSVYARRKVVSQEREAGAAIVTAETNKEAANAERRAAEAANNASSGAQLDDDLAAGRKQF